MHVQTLRGAGPRPRFCSAAMVLGVVGLAITLAATPVSRAGAAGSVARPHPFARQTDAGNDFVQVAALSAMGRADGRTVNGVETKIRHESTIVAPAADASYSYSAGAYTTTGYWLQMGYLVLGSDGDGLARYFIQVLNPNGTTNTWVLSRTGAANPPPACSACSGDAGTGGFPFAFTSDSSGMWTFWFDGISKAKVKLGPAHNTIDTGRVYYLGEVTAGAKVAANVMGPRTALRTLRLWSNAAGSWVEAAAAQAAYYGTPYGTIPSGACPASPYGIAWSGAQFDTYAQATFQTVAAGSGVNCTPAGTTLWPRP